MHSHSDEIKYWAEHDNGTKVWYRVPNCKLWAITSQPCWEQETTYICNDEWADLRKKQADGKQLQFKDGDLVPEWKDGELTVDNLEMTKLEWWRIKPEEPNKRERK